MQDEWDCEHGNYAPYCKTCHPELIHKCKHGIDREEENCEPCDYDDQVENDREMDMQMSMEESYCKHDILESECHECGAEMDRLAEKAREQAEWNHFHPLEE